MEPSGGHAAHARAHAHYETGDHVAGLAWMDAWVLGDGARTDSLTHFSWHAALHELSLGDTAAVRRRYDAQAPAPPCRGLPRAGRHRLAALPLGAHAGLLRRTVDGRGGRPHRPLRAGESRDGLPRDACRCRAAGGGGHRRTGGAWPAGARGTAAPPTARWSLPLAGALALLSAGRWSEGADRLAALSPQVWRLGGSDAQREIVEEARIAALLRAGRYDEARLLLDARLDRRPAARDEAWRAEAQAATILSP
ncbi:hypothetical protein G5V59_04770 [Nocardioides sp. W3-2-3]|nr:hypothetical protein [Nocardioides convexus]